MTAAQIKELPGGPTTWRDGGVRWLRWLVEPDTSFRLEQRLDEDPTWFTLSVTVWASHLVGYEEVLKIDGGERWGYGMPWQDGERRALALIREMVAAAEPKVPAGCADCGAALDSTGTPLPGNVSPFGDLVVTCSSCGFRFTVLT